jgi:hypothetical protein
VRPRFLRAAALTAAAALIGVVPAVNGISSAAPPTNHHTVSAAARSIPTPADFFGFPMGTEGRLAEFPDIKRYLRLVADKSDDVDYQVVGKTTEGNDFPVLRISSADNLHRLDKILDINARLSDPAEMTKEAKRAGEDRDTYARQLARTSVPVYYIEAGIHSTEVGNTQALMDVVHRLATEDSEFVSRVLDNMVIVMVPSQNPDGHDRVVDYYNDTAGTDYDRTFPDLYQKYVGHDDNRDWFMFTQKESQIRVRLEQKYRPAVQHYMHGAGTNSPRIWSPPWDEPMSPTLDPLTVASANSIGQEANRDLIAAGDKGATTDDAYGIMWNADVMGYSTFQGTTTWLTEIAAAKDLWSTYTSDKVLAPSTATLRSPLPYDTKTWSPAQIVTYAKDAVYSGLDTVAHNPQEWLYNNMYQVNADSETWDGGPYAYVVPGDQRDPYAVYDMLHIFDFGKVRIEQATAPFRAGGTNYPKGSWILRTDQPLGRWVDQLLRIDEYPDSARKCADGCPLIMPYSETTDNLGLLMGVTVDPVEEAFDAHTTVVSGIEPAAPPMPKAPGAQGAYVLSPASYGLGKVITALEKADVPMFRATEELKTGGTTLPPGALITPATETARTALAAASAATGLRVYASPQVPETPAIQLRKRTRIGLVRGIDNASGGWMWWMFDQFGIDYDIVDADDYQHLDQYDTVILPPGISTNSLSKGIDPAKYPKEFAWARGVPDAPAKLQAYVQQGGNLVAMGSSALTATDALSLPVQNIAPRSGDDFEVPGALLKQTFRTSSPAAWGMPASWPVWYDDDPAFRLTGDGDVAASYPDDADLLVSGYARGDEALSGAANVATFGVGKGSATVIGGEVAFRTWPRAAWTLVTNALYNNAGTTVSAQQMARALH